MRVKSEPKRLTVSTDMKSFVKSITEKDFDESALKQLCIIEEEFRLKISEEKEYINEISKTNKNVDRMTSLMLGITPVYGAGTAETRSEGIDPNFV